MLVTSDIFDLERIAHWRRETWSENLICGVDVGGMMRRGPEAEARYLVEAANTCHLMPEMRWAGYSKAGEHRTRPLKPASMLRLADGKLRAAAHARGVLLRGERAAEGSHVGTVVFGGETSSNRARRAPQRPGGPFDVDFCYPIDANPRTTARSLLQLSLEHLDCEYGYYFVRDDYCLPMGYCKGIVSPLDYSLFSDRQLKEVGDWRNYVSENRIWTDPWPRLRDLFEINLLSERHTKTKIEGFGYLLDWITAAGGRGLIEPLERGRVLWTLTDAEMLEHRDRLYRAGVLLSCPDRIYRDLTPNFRGRGTRSPPEVV